jgi:F5/8 type C domain
LSVAADLRDPARVLRLPNNILIAPLMFPHADFGAVALSGRYVRIQLSGTNNLSLAEVRVISSRGGVVSNLAQGKAASQSSTLGGMTGAAEHAVDGNTNGEFWASSVTHTNADANAWWQVDLGSPVAIDSIEIWNRTDCCSDRLNDYWIFVSDTPFAPSDTPGKLEHRAGTFSTHQTRPPLPSVSVAGSSAEEDGGSARHVIFDNGYLRAIGGENSGTAKGFRTDGAAKLELDVNALKPVKVQYLFWPNDRLHFYLQGLPVAATVEDGLETVTIPPGNQHLEIRYVNWPLRFFLLFYVLYALAYIAALAAPLLRLSPLDRLRSKFA